MGKLNKIEPPTEKPTYRGSQIMCPCMNEITIKDLVRGYHSKCDRRVEILTWRKFP